MKKKCFFLFRNTVHKEAEICQGTYLLTDRCRETDYIVSLVQRTSGLVFSLASLWWIRKECLARFLLSLWCFQVIVHTSHPFTLVAPSGMSLTILSAQSHLERDAWNDLFDLQFVTLQFCVARITHAFLTGRWSHCFVIIQEKWCIADPIVSYDFWGRGWSSP